MKTMLQAYFQAFSLKQSQLNEAIHHGEDDLVRLVDRELEPLVNDIIAYEATTREELHTQLQFLCSLIRDQADDRSSVVRKSVLMSGLIDRYFLEQQSTSKESFSSIAPRRDTPPAAGFYDQSYFNEAILDCIDERVAVVTTDYRYLYTNETNARRFDRTPLSMIGCHLSEFLGEDEFQALAKPALDRCFSGEKVEYFHYGHLNGRSFVTRCRLTPLRGPNGSVIAAVAVLHNADDMADFEAD